MNKIVHIWLIFGLLQLILQCQSQLLWWHPFFVDSLFVLGASSTKVVALPTKLTTFIIKVVKFVRITMIIKMTFNVIQGCNLSLILLTFEAWSTSKLQLSIPSPLAQYHAKFQVLPYKWAFFFQIENYMSKNIGLYLFFWEKKFQLVLQYG